MKSNHSSLPGHRLQRARSAMCLELAASVGLAASLLFSSANPVRGDDYVRNLPGDFSNTDWTNYSKEPPESPSGPPGAADDANLNGRAVTANSGSVMTLRGGPLTVSGGFNAKSAIAVTLQGSGTLTASSSSGIIVNGGHLMTPTDVGKFINVSNGGSEVAGSLLAGTTGTVVSGGSLVVNSKVTNLNLGFQSGGTGRMPNITNSHGTGGLTINGGGSALTVDQNFSVQADFLDLSSGGALTVNGQLSLDGAIENGHAIGGGGHWQDKGTTISTSDGILVGGSAPSPGFSLAIDFGAVVRSGLAVIGADAGGIGTVSLLDAGTLWEVQSSGMAIGRSGTGSFTMNFGAKLLFDNGTSFAIGLNNGSNGTLSATNSTVDASGAVVAIGEFAGSTGRMSLATSTFLVGHDFTIGDSGSGGLTISSSSQATVSGAATKFVIGKNAGSHGGVTVRDNNGNSNGASYLTVNSPMTVGLSGLGTLSIGAGGVVNLTSPSGLIGGAMSGSTGTIFVVNDGTKGVAPQLTLAGPLVIGDAGAASLDAEADAQLTLAPGTEVNLILGARHGGSGTLTMDAAFSFVDNAPILIGKAGQGTVIARFSSTVQLFGFSAPFSPGGQATITVDESTWVNNYNIYLGTPSPNDPPSTLLIRNQSTMRVGQRMTIFQSGTVTIDTGSMMAVGSGAFGPGGSLRVSDGGILSGYGRVQGDVLEASGGKIYPGNSPGVLTIEGNYQQNAGSTYSAEIGGAATGDFDQLSVTGVASLGGTLNVRLVNGFTPSVGQTFRLLKAGSVSGAFASISQPSQAGISLTSDATGIIVTITSVVAGAPVISGATTANAAPGVAFSYQITATNNPTGFGATNLPAGLTINNSTGLITGTPTTPGAFIVPLNANNASGSGQADLTIVVGPIFGVPALPPSNLINISTRMRVLTSDNVLIGGFIITGTDPKKVLIRGIGPSLGNYGITEALEDPTLELHQGSTTVATNDNWKINDQSGQSQEASITATTIPPANDLESAILTTLTPGAYTAILAGKNQTSGIGVVEVYDLAQAANSQLANISSRGFVDTGDNVMIGGFIVGGGTGGGNAKVIVRALGPSIPVVGALGDPTLELHDASGTIVSSNDDWKTRPDGSSQQAEIEATTIPPTNDLDSALVATLLPGNYTAVVRGKNNATGVGLVEVYALQ